ISTRKQSGAREIPIYVGKAIPPGNRRGVIDPRAKIGDPLFKRLKEHAESIRCCGNLDVADFDCRYLVVDDVWIPLGESLLIQSFRPVWNVALDGFGNHDPGGGRRGQKRSPWDTLHPGRPWARKLVDGEKTEAILRREVRQYFTRFATDSAPDELR
ncbi:MAG: Eco29kI family restriction endonuclease, partial [Planctomycetaceae bacterium]